MRVWALGIVTLCACPAAAQEVRQSGPPPGVATGAPGAPDGWSITIGAARILGVADRLGSLEVGKDADLALYDGDPFEYTSHCTGVIIDGQVVNQVPR